MPRLIPPARGHRGGARHQHGVGLIEVMVAVLVVSIGFLGIAALQAHALTTNNSAMARSMATMASYSILDAMRADRVAALSGAYNHTVHGDNCPAVGDALASRQLNQWCQLLAGSLGASDATTGEVKCVNQGECTITIAFDDSRAGGGDSVQTVTRAML